MPVHCDWRLNEQMYGALTGLNKRKTAERYGAELTQRWRRSCELLSAAQPYAVVAYLRVFFCLRLTFGI